MTESLSSGRLSSSLKRGRATQQVAEALGASEPSVRQWVAAYKKSHGDAFPGSGKLSGQDEEIRRLKEELRVTRMERDILKKRSRTLRSARNEVRGYRRSAK